MMPRSDRDKRLIREGMAEARQAGIRLGRPPPPAQKIAEARQLLAADPDLSMNQVARRVGLSPHTVKKYI